MKRKNFPKGKRGMKDIFLRSFLGISIVLSVFLVSNCDDLFNHIPIFPGNGGNSNPPDFTSSENTSYTASIFKLLGKTALEDVEGDGISWAMGALGLSESSPDYTEQLNKIDDDLQVIIGQLNGIQNELNQINSELTIINCTEWATQLSNEKARVDNLLLKYQSFLATAVDSGTITNDQLSDWVYQVLAINNYSSQEPMDQILSKFASTLISGGNTGVLPACIQSIPVPADNSFGIDTMYYNQVRLFTDYYYAYQVKALFLFNEAQHYQAWAAVGAPTSDYLSADSVSYVCSDARAKSYCISTADRTNQLYNDLIDQHTISGAPYTDENFVLLYNANDPYLWPRSLEDFTIAAGDDCADPLTSANPCGKTAGFYDNASMQSIQFKGYTGWLKAGSDLLTTLLSGWTSGTAGHYLQSKLGFKNMQNKIIISSNTVVIELTNASATFKSVTFFDTDFDYSFVPGLVSNSAQFNKIVDHDYHSSGSRCSSVWGNYYYSFHPDSKLPAPDSRNTFYNIQGRTDYGKDFAGVSYVCSNGGFQLGPDIPGWLSGNRGSNAKQFRWPVLATWPLACTENRSNRNVGGVWTMCGDDFTAYLDYNVPRPETCDNSAKSVTCNVIAPAIANAKSIFGNNSKGQRRL